MNVNTSICTPKKHGLVVPYGCIISHPRWNGSELISKLRSSVNITFVNEVGAFDFMPSDVCCVVYITESDLIGNSCNCKKRIEKLENAAGFSEKYVLIDKSDITREYFDLWQDIIVFECDIHVFPVTSISQTVVFFNQIVKTASKQTSSNFLLSTEPRFSCTDVAILSVVQKFPQIGYSKAKLLLEEFGSIQRIAAASVKDLSKIVSSGAGEKLHMFLTEHVF